MSYLDHPSIPRQCRYDDDCTDPPLSRVSISFSDQGRPVLVAIRPLFTAAAPSSAKPICTDHLHYVLDEALIHSLPDRDESHEEAEGVPMLVEASEADLIDELVEELADGLVDDLLGPADPDALPGGPDHGDRF